MFSVPDKVVPKSVTLIICFFLYQNGPGLFGALNDGIPFADLDEGLRQRNVPAADPPSDEQVGNTSNEYSWI